MSAQAIVCWDPAEFALGAVRDGQVRLGERIAVFGLGAIGLVLVEMARLSGAVTILAVDPIDRRRAAALRRGATAAFDPREGDVGVAIQRATDGAGPDAVFEVSGAYPALHEAIRCCAVGGRVVPVAFYQGEARGLRLGEEWHMNRVTVLSSRACTEPDRDYPMWNNRRIRQAAFDLLRTGRLQVDDLVDPIVPFDRSPEAYREIDEHPERSIKLGIRYD
jgi:threonine dehydrogenase-like Zn-dependent dehydrogenase